MVLGILLLIATTWVLWYLGTTHPIEREIIWRRRTDFGITSLLFPAWLALFIADPATRLKFGKALRPSRTLALFAVCFAAMLLIKHIFHVHLHGTPPPQVDVLPSKYAVATDVDFHMVPTFIIPVVFPLIILSTLLNPGHAVSRMLEWKVLRKIGRVSYSLYLWQQLFFLSFFYINWPFGHVSKLFIGPATLGCALLSYFALEKPMIRLGHRLAPPATPGHPDLRAS
jgi:peptidoglycan/LPS O-acetylase OafA/YrhL